MQEANSHTHKNPLLRLPWIQLTKFDLSIISNTSDIDMTSADIHADESQGHFVFQLYRKKRSMARTCDVHLAKGVNTSLALR